MGAFVVEEATEQLVEHIAKYRRRMRGASAVVATVAALVLSALPAEASGTYSGRAHIYGGGTWVGDWGDEGDLSTGTNTYSNATCLWQKILWAVFGSKTKAQTLYWQEMNELSGLDGIAGKETFGKADDYLYEISEDSSGAFRLRYDGIYYKPYFIRNADGNYGFYDGTNTYRLAGYDYRTCS